MEWIKSHLLFCIFALTVFVLVTIIILVIAIQNKKEKRQKNKKGIALRRADLNKKKVKEDKMEYQKPILKQNLRTGEKISRKYKTKEKPAQFNYNEEELKVQSVMVVKAKKVKNPKFEEYESTKEKERLENEVIAKEIYAKEKQKTKEVKKSLEKSSKVKEEKGVKKPMKKVVKKVEVKKGTETYRVVYDKEQKNWIVKIDGGERASRRCGTKEEALKIAKDFARKKDADLSVHKKNGKFQKQ